MTTRFVSGWMAFVFVAAALAASPRDAQWEQVRDARQKGLPKSAVAALEPIIAGAMADKAYPEAIKAIAEKVAFEGEIQGNRAEEKIVRFQTELDKAPAPMKPVMEAILAHWYWQYFQQNPWRFLQRTQTAVSPGPDIQTWDLARILAEIDRHFTAALANEKELKATPIADYDALLTKGTVPDDYRPTLFDFLVYDALSFYQTGEQGVTIAEQTFEVTADSPVFGTVRQFLAWPPETTDPRASTYKAIRLYQKLLAYHDADEDRAAFDDADLARLMFGHNAAVGDDKDARYESALARFAEETSRREISARARAALATQWQRHDDPARAHAEAERGFRAFPKTAGGAMCFNVIRQIEAPSARLSTERVWNAPWPTLDVTYRNVTHVYFRAIAVNFEDYVSRRRWNIGGIDRRDLGGWLEQTPALAWDGELPATRDYRERVEKLPAPKTLRPGFYMVVASYDRNFERGDNEVSATTLWVSDLALVVRTNRDSAAGDGLLVTADEGNPVAGATVRFWQQDKQGWLKPAGDTKTDDAGRFNLPVGRATVALAESGGQAVSTAQEVYLYRSHETDTDHTQVVFFTDRSIYRPGQVINFKGIAIHFDSKSGNYGVEPDKTLTVVFNDPNGKEITRVAVQTNDYGSFSGVFTAPRDRLTGMMQLRVLEENGATGVRVEEYKRPKFYVEVKPPSVAPRLGQPVAVTGVATAYTGAAIGGAKVAWRIERRVQLPPWCWWWSPPQVKAIAHGTAVTEPDGTFTVRFTAEPDRTVPAENEPVFAFQVHADVTDTAGETRSDDRTLRIGYMALEASLSADSWQTVAHPVELDVGTKSLDGDPEPAKGKLTVYALQQPVVVARAALGTRRYFAPLNPGARVPTQPKYDPANVDTWPLGARVVSRDVATDAKGSAHVAVLLPVGIYRAMLETQDRFGRKVTAQRTIQVLSPGNPHYGIKLADELAAPRWSAEPGETFTALWGTGYATGRAFVEIECNGRPIRSYWTAPDHTQVLIEEPVTEAMRGGFTLRVSYVRENRAYLKERVVDVPWTNKQLHVKWESFRSKLLPGEKETWTAVVTGPAAKGATAEMVATLYDASLDQFLPHPWPDKFDVLRREFPLRYSQFQNSEIVLSDVRSWEAPEQRSPMWEYRSFPSEVLAGGSDRQMIMQSAFQVAASVETRGYYAANTLAGTRRAKIVDAAELSMPAVASPASGAMPSPVDSRGPAEEIPKPDLNQVAARRNLQETAFFFPHLVSDHDGVVRIEFTTPEALTTWRFLGFAHDAQLRSGFLTDTAVTAKDLMVEPNPPRFVREGDVIEFTVKVSNQTDKPQTGDVRLTFADAATQRSMDAALGNRSPEQRFEIPAKQSRTYSWRIAVPDGMGFLTYKAVGASAQASDGEEGYLPVLSRRVLVTESLPLPIRGEGTKQFEFPKLLESGGSPTLQNESLTVQMVSHPAWYAVMALPYLMEYPYECSEQVFNRLYANALARQVGNSDPKIRRVFDLWKNTPALDSPLQKNQDLKAIMLEDTPWLRDAQAESQARRNVGLLFDANRLDAETARAMRTLADRQLSDGLWSWFPGGRPSEYISLYIVTGFGRLRHLGVNVDAAPAVKALTALDAWIDDEYQRILKQPDPETYTPSYTDCLYLYGRSFFLRDQPIAATHQAAVDFLLKQAGKYWLQVGSRQCQAQLALGLQRFGDTATPLAIMRSLKELSITSEEMGMYWRDSGSSWWWYDAPIETQAMMIEAFGEVAHDAKAVEDCKVWLLKQKQTQDWGTTKATADAVYALLLRGSDLLASDQLVDVSLGGAQVKPDQVEAGTGFYEQRFVRGEIKPAMGHITVTKPDAGVSWGAVHWQYLEDMAKVSPHEGTPLQLKKALFVKRTTAKGQVLEPVTGPVHVGDELVVRIELRTDREMEYVHLKDQRGSGTEPVNVLSGYRYQDGLAYYESTRDTATDFFIDYLPRGTYVFEYPTRVQLKGRYQTGIAEIQCMYAPEFNSHSGSIEIEVR